MTGQAIEVRARQTFGTNANRRLRKEGLIPGIVYGQGKESIAIAVDPRRIREILGLTSGGNTIFRLEMSEGEQVFNLDMMLRDIQVDPVTDALLHVDFMRLDMTTLIQVKIPVELVGTAKGVKEQGGRLDFINRELNVECLPADIPDHVAVDVSEMEIGDSVRVKDLAEQTAKMTILDKESMVLLVLNAPKMVVEDEPEEELAEGEEAAAEGEGEKTDAPTAESEEKK